MRAYEFITEAKTTREDFEGMTIEMVKNGHVLVINALDDWGNNILGSVAFNIGDNNELDPQDLKVDERYQGQGIARIMYDYAKSKGYEIHRSYDQTDAGAGFWNKHRGEDVRIWEAFDNPYKGKWEKSDYGDVDLNTKLPDGTNLSIMFNNQQGDEGEEVVQVEFYRNNSQEVTGEGDAQRIFATVLDAIQKYIKKYKPQKLSFSASKATDPTIYYEPDQPQPNPESRAKLYDRLVQRYSKALGYRAFRADNGDIVIYELSRIKQGVAEGDDKLKDPIANAILDFYQHAGHISKEPVDNYVGTAKEMLSQVSDPTVKSKILDIFKQAKQSPYVQGGVVTTIGALLAGGVLSSAQKMGLTPAQTNLALQAILNTVIPTVVSRINGKSWSDTIKYTLASAGIGTGIAGIMEDDLEEDWRSALATGAMAGAMAMGAQAKGPQMVHQIVEPGDTIYSIARQTGADPKEIYKLNKMDRNTKLEIGQKVLVPDYSKPISKMPATVKPTLKQEPAKVAKPEPSLKDKISSMIPKFSHDKEDEGVTLLSNNSDAEAALQTAAKAAGLKGSELAQFMAQTRHESWDFSKMKEVGSKKQFAKYEKSRLAKRLGNKVKGDGELFKGRGFIQLTGRDNYTRASQQIFGDDRLVKNPELASRLDVGAKIALWFWKNQVRPNVSNFNNTTEVVKAINANEPTNVVKQRHKKFKEYLAVL